MFKELIWQDPISRIDLHYNQKNNVFEGHNAQLYPIDEKGIVGIEQNTIGEENVTSTFSRKLSSHFISDKNARSAYLTYLELWPEDIVLEVCVGTGANIKLLPMKSVKFIGVDASQKELEKAYETKKDHELALTLCRANPQSLPFKDNSFNSVFHDDFNTTISNPIPVVKEMIRVAKPKAKLLYTCKDPQPILDALKNEVRNIQVHELKKSKYVVVTCFKK